MPDQDPNLLLDVLERLVRAGVDGTGPLESAQELAAHHLSRQPDAEAAIAALVRAETAKCASVGFLAGLGGFVVLPIALPTAIAGAAVIESRMVGAIAVLRGWSVDDPKVRLFVQACLLGQGAVEEVKRVGVNVLAAAGSAAGRRVLARYLAKQGARAVPKIPGRFVPLLGGVVGGVTDAAVCRSIAKIALRELPAAAAPPASWTTGDAPLALPAPPT